MSALALLLAAGIAGDSPYSYPILPFEGPLGVEVARDLDGDGRRELLGFGGTSLMPFVGVLTPLPGGGWTTASTLPVSRDPRVLLLTDVTGDGLEDLLVAGLSGVDVYPRLDGLAFGARVTTLAGHHLILRRATTPDFDGDGHADLVLASLQPGFAIEVRRGNGDGSFVPYVFGLTSPRDVWTVELEGEARDGLAFWLGGPDRFDLTRLETNDLVPLTSSPLPTAPHEVELADVNADGLDDLTLIESAGALDRVRILPAVAPGVFGQPVVSRVEPGIERVRWDDVDGDDRVDLLLEGFDLRGVAFQDDDLRLDVRTVPLQLGLTPFAVADADDDGLRDLLVSSSWGLVVLRQRAPRVFERDLAIPATEGTQQLALGDFDGDGLDDAVFGRGSSQLGITPRVDVHVSDGRGGFARTVSVPLPLNMNGVLRDLETGDFDGDGRLDLLVPTSQGVFAVLRTPGGLLAPPVLVQPAPPSGGGSASGDVDGDGFDDALLGGRLYRGSPGGLVASTRLASTRDWALADVDGDGALDAVLRPDSAPARIETWLGDGQGGFAPPVTYFLPEFLLEPPIGVDVDGDGDEDLLARSASSSSVLLLRSRGAGDYDPPVTVLTGPILSPVSSADVNGDGAPDLAAATTGWTLVVASNAGDGTFGEPARHRAATPTPTAVALGRFVAGAPPGALLACGSTSLPGPATLKQPRAGR